MNARTRSRVRVDDEDARSATAAWGVIWYQSWVARKDGSYLLKELRRVRPATRRVHEEMEFQE
jgi:hypothetical protein